MGHYICVHGHFYQPPREDPATGVVPLERDAAPFTNFNEKILAECYRPNAELGNFDRISFDLGPTLGVWLHRHHPQVLARIAKADQQAVARTGYGNAVAQSFHHTILPLASERDRLTEIRWGSRWFEHTFGRPPRGIWLPETAVDYPTLEACASEGLSFTIFSPEQADGEINTRYPYRIPLPSGKHVDALFYEGPLSGTVSFDPVATTSAPEFLQRFVLPRFHAPGVSSDDPIVLIASDGEVYGHHHRFKDYFLQDLLTVRAEQANLTPVSVEQYLALHPPTRTTEIREFSSWGCGHELLRWRGDCYCTPGDGAWKGGLRRAFDRLARRIDAYSERALEPIGVDLWVLRDSYVDVVIGAVALGDWLACHGLPSSGTAAETVVTVMEAQRHRLAMYASCAFYWDDLTRIEAGYGVRSARYAASRSDAAFGSDLVASFSADLVDVVGWKTAKSAAALYVAAGD